MGLTRAPPPPPCRARADEERAILAENGAVDALLTLLSDEASQTEAAAALAEIALDEAHQETIAHHGGMAPLVLLLARSRVPAAQLQAARAIANLTACPGNQKARPARNPTFLRLGLCGAHS